MGKFLHHCPKCKLELSWEWLESLDKKAMKIFHAAGLCPDCQKAADRPKLVLKKKLILKFKPKLILKKRSSL